MQYRMGRRVLLLPFPLQGHQVPMLQLGDILHSKGFAITILHTHLNAPNAVDYPHFTFHPFPLNMLGDEASVKDLIALLNSRDHEHCVTSLRDLLEKILLENADKEPVACLITDTMWHFTQTVADSLKLPRLVLRVTNASFYKIFMSLPLLREKGYMSAIGSKLDDLVPELPPEKLKDALQFCKTEEVFELAYKMVETINLSSGIIFNSSEEIEGPDALAIIRQDVSIPVFAPGPFHKLVPASSSSLLEQDRSFFSWLDDQAPKSVLYVSFDSLVKIDEQDFLEIAWGLAKSKQPFLWVVRPGWVRGFDGSAPLPNGFQEMVGDCGRIVTWAPQQEVLTHPAVGGFWTHSGWNSTLESIGEGVPMLCLPCIGDQMVNARYVSDVWKVGFQFDNGLEREEIAKKIRKLMVEKEGQETRQRMECLKEKAILGIAPGGSSYSSLESLVAHILSF